MLIQVSGKGFELGSDLRNEVEERLETALNKFGARIRRVNVFLADENGPKNGIDKNMRAVINVRRLPRLLWKRKGIYGTRCWIVPSIAPSIPSDVRWTGYVQGQVEQVWLEISAKELKHEMPDLREYRSPDVGAQGY